MGLFTEYNRLIICLHFWVQHDPNCSIIRFLEEEISKEQERLYYIDLDTVSDFGSMADLEPYFALDGASLARADARSMVSVERSSVHTGAPLLSSIDENYSVPDNDSSVALELDPSILGATLQTQLVQLPFEAICVILEASRNSSVPSQEQMSSFQENKPPVGMAGQTFTVSHPSKLSIELPRLDPIVKTFCLSAGVVWYEMFKIKHEGNAMVLTLLDSCRSPLNPCYDLQSSAYESPRFDFNLLMVVEDWKPRPPPEPPPSMRHCLRPLGSWRIKLSDGILTNLLCLSANKSPSFPVTKQLPSHSNTYQRRLQRKIKEIRSEISSKPNRRIIGAPCQAENNCIVVLISDESFELPLAFLNSFQESNHGRSEKRLSLGEYKRAVSWSKYLVSSGAEIKGEGEEEWSTDLAQLFIGRKFASGRHSRIYRGIYRQRDVAIKLISHPEEDEELAAVLDKQFNSEIALLLRLRHPNIISFVAASGAKFHST